MAGRERATSVLSDASRSHLIDITWQSLHAVLSGNLEGLSPETLGATIAARREILRACWQPFGKPNATSRSKVKGGTVELADGTMLHLQKHDQDCVLALSDRFDVDEINALILLRTFLYNEGLPSTTSGNADASFIEEIIDAVTPFYQSERISLMRCLIPLFRAGADKDSSINNLAAKFVEELMPQAEDANWLTSIVDALEEKSNRNQVPPAFESNLQSKIRFAKQIVREQLILLEIAFWAIWSTRQCSSTVTLRILQVLYKSDLGNIQAHSSLLLDEEGVQLLRDIETLWNLVAIVVMDLERSVTSSGYSLAEGNDGTILASGDHLKQIQEILFAAPYPKYGLVLVSWSCLHLRLLRTVSQLPMGSMQPKYAEFFKSVTQLGQDGKPIFEVTLDALLSPEGGLCSRLLDMLKSSPVFSTSAAWSTGSSITEPNVVAYRSVMKGLLIAILECYAAEYMKDYEMFLDAWIQLFGSGESDAVAPLSQEFWKHDWHESIARRALFDITRTRFPVQMRPFVRLLKAMTGAGSSDAGLLPPISAGSEARAVCSLHVFYFLQHLPSFTQVIPPEARSTGLYSTGPNRLPSGAVTGWTLITQRPIQLPGGSVLPARAIAQPLSNLSERDVGPDATPSVVLWDHTHSGWRLLVDLLTDYISRRRLAAHMALPGVGARSTEALTLTDIGVDIGNMEEEALIVADALDLMRSVIADHPTLAEQLMEALESDVVDIAEPPLDLVQITAMVLEDALTRSASVPSALITSSLTVLASLLPLPAFSNRVWLYLRSTTVLFGNERHIGMTAALVTAERGKGEYEMTLTLLDLVQALLNESIASQLTSEDHVWRIKSDILLRAFHFVHAQIWVEYSGWKYQKLGDRFEIGRRIAHLSITVLKHSPAGQPSKHLEKLVEFVEAVYITRATTSSVNPLVLTIASSGQNMDSLGRARRFAEAGRLELMLETHMRLYRLLIARKRASSFTTKLSLLEHSLLSPEAGKSEADRMSPMDSIVQYAGDRTLGPRTPVEAVRLLCILCASTSLVQPSPPSLIGCFRDVEAVVASFIRIVRHPYEEPPLRNAVWAFISLCVDQQSALGRLFVSGQFQIPSVKSGEKAQDGESAHLSLIASPTILSRNAITAACNILLNWKDLWEHNPQLLASVVRFLDVVWCHSLEHREAITSAEKTADFWKTMASIAQQDLPPVETISESEVFAEGVLHSDLHITVSDHSYRVVLKSYALHIIGLDIQRHRGDGKSLSASKDISSLQAILPIFASEDSITDLLSEAASTSYSPSLYDDVVLQADSRFPSLTLRSMEHSVPAVEREFGDDFLFSMEAVRERVQPHITNQSTQPEMEEFLHSIYSVNLNLSVAHAHMALANAWKFLLQQSTPYLKPQTKSRSTLFALAANIAEGISRETRSGDMMSTIYAGRLGLLLALLEAAWFSEPASPKDAHDLDMLMKAVEGIVKSEVFPPLRSLMGEAVTSFHRTVLHVVFFCMWNARLAGRDIKTLNSEQRLTIVSLVTSVSSWVLSALRFAFRSAQGRVDVELDKDMEILVTVFDQCIHRDLNLPSSVWLTQCHETEVVPISMELLSNIDLSGFSHLDVMRALKSPLYGPHILFFHLSLANIAASAEKLASAGMLSAYNGNSISHAISLGALTTTLQELPRDRSPPHRMYCMMLAILTSVMEILGPFSHFVDSEIPGFVNHYQQQLSHPLRWSIGDPFNMPFVEEMERVVDLYQAIADRSSAEVSRKSPSISRVIVEEYVPKAVILLQHVNYALTHPNHLSSLLEPVGVAEKSELAKETISLSAQSAVDISDPSNHPILSQLVRRLFRVSRAIVSTIVAMSGGVSILVTDRSEWPSSKALLQPTMKVAIGEQASIGTVLELASSSLDVLRTLIPKLSTNSPFSLRAVVREAHETVSSALLCAVTQTMLSAVDSTPENVDIDDGRLDPDELGKSLAGRKSLTVGAGERWWGNLSSEIAQELRTLLVKAQAALGKSDALFKTGDAALLKALLRFVEERTRTD